MATPSSLQLAAVFIFVLLLLVNRLYSRRNLPLPPGPRGLPLVGNIRDLPPPGRAEYLHWLKFKDTYGPLSSITVLGQPMIIIHDKAAAEFLLEKTSLKTSGRPSQPFAAECGLNRMLPGRQYDADFKRHRKHMHQLLGTKNSVIEYSDIQDVESKRLLYRVLNDPENLAQHFKR